MRHRRSALRQGGIRAIDWSTIFLFAGTLALAEALETTGVGHLIAGLVVALCGGEINYYLLITVLFLFCGLITQFMSNTAACALLAPIGLQIAQGLGVAPKSVLIVVAAAACSSYLTPMGHAAQHPCIRLRRLPVPGFPEGGNAPLPAYLPSVYPDRPGRVAHLAGRACFNTQHPACFPFEVSKRKGKEIMFDIKIINGMVIDGIGDTRYRADIGITGDQITAIGNLADAPALETVDARGRLSAPALWMYTHIPTCASCMITGSSKDL